jgi:hypothetical protein
MSWLILDMGSKNKIKGVVAIGNYDSDMPK